MCHDRRVNCAFDMSHRNDGATKMCVTKTKFSIQFLPHRSEIVWVSAGNAYHATLYPHKSPALPNLADMRAMPKMCAKNTSSQFPWPKTMCDNDGHHGNVCARAHKIVNLCVCAHGAGLMCFVNLANACRCAPKMCTTNASS